MMKRLYIHRRGGPLRYLISFAVLCCSTAIYADSIDPIAEGNSNADRIAAQAQVNIQQQQRILTQRLQALAAAMQAQNPTVPIVVQPPPQVQKQPTPVAPPAAAATPVAPQAAATPETNATGLAPPSQNNNSNQWNYGF